MRVGMYVCERFILFYFYLVFIHSYFYLVYTIFINTEGVEGDRVI